MLGDTVRSFFGKTMRKESSISMTWSPFPAIVTIETDPSLDLAETDAGLLIKDSIRK
jgi:hypothetical protein